MENIENIIEKYILSIDINKFNNGKIKKELSHILTEYGIKQEVTIHIDYEPVQFEYNLLRLNEKNDIPKLLNENNMNKIKDGLLEKEMPSSITIFYLNDNFQLSSLKFNYYHSLNEENKKIETEFLLNTNIIDNNNVLESHNTIFWNDDNYYRRYNKRVYPDDYQFKIL